jgi:hypothetical protein
MLPFARWNGTPVRAPRPSLATSPSTIQLVADPCAEDHQVGPPNRPRYTQQVFTRTGLILLGLGVVPLAIVVIILRQDGPGEIPAILIGAPLASTASCSADRMCGERSWRATTHPAGSQRAGCSFASACCTSTAPFPPCYSPARISWQWQPTASRTCRGLPSTTGKASSAQRSSPLLQQRAWQTRHSGCTSVGWSATSGSRDKGQPVPRSTRRSRMLTHDCETA